MKRILSLLLIILLALSLSACQKEELKPNNNQGCDIIDDECGDDKQSSLLAFKEAYESINGQQNSSGKIHREISIPDDHPFVEIDAASLIEKINNKETFYAYIGDELCPWCRSVLEMCIKVAKENSIDTIYYVQIWDDDSNEILRDQYKMVDGKLTKTVEGKEEYYTLLKSWNDFLDDYVVEENKVGEKRIFAPSFAYVENGELKRFTTAISDKQEDSRAELTAEILADEEKMFNELFGN